MTKHLPLSTGDQHAVHVLYAASRLELEQCLYRLPTYQRTAVRELVRLIEHHSNARASSDEDGGQ